MSEMVLYDTMVRAIVECHQVDELKDMHDKARALEMYAKQAKNIEAERRATEIRIRAERKVGQLLVAMKRTPPRESAKQAIATRWDTTSNDGMSYASPKSEYAQGVEKAGLSPQTAHRWQQLAKVPEHEFESMLNEPDTKPTTAELLRRVPVEVPDAVAAGDYIEASLAAPGRVPVRMDPDALGIWGRLRDVENITSRRMPEELLSQMTEPMVADLQRIVPPLVEWLQQLEEKLHA